MRLPALPLPVEIKKAIQTYYLPPEQYLEIASDKFRNQGFEILQAQEVFRPIRFRDVGALVWFARVIPWEFPGFSVEQCLEQLLEAQKHLERDGVLEGRIHRFLLVAKKPVGRNPYYKTK